MAALPFAQLEKIFQEKVFYNLLVNNYLNKEILDVAGSGFWLKPETFTFEMFVGEELTSPVCKQLATLIGEKYNKVVTSNARQKSAGWAFAGIGTGLWSFQVFINSQHDVDVLNNETFKKMIGYTTY